MAKRRKLEAPSAEDLSRLEQEFRHETTPRGPLAAPISQVAAETAGAMDLRPETDRVQSAKDRSDAERLREADAKGLIMADIPLEDIDPDAIIRDRISLGSEEMNELRLSIAAHGLRLPVEVFERAGQGEGPRYGLLSGYRRYRAVQELRGMSGGNGYGSIRAIIRDPRELGGTFGAMVEENEVRANLSHFERGRIAVVASQEGAFVNVEAAVDALFTAASKAKRSKIRSFALIFEELGDMLNFPETLKEKDGLKLAQALRAGGEERIRAALAAGLPASPEDEWAMIEAAIDAQQPPERDPSRGGRPKQKDFGRVRQTNTGITISTGQEGKDWIIRLKGDRLDRVMVQDLADRLEQLLAGD